MSLFTELMNAPPAHAPIGPHHLGSCPRCRELVLAYSIRYRSGDPGRIDVNADGTWSHRPTGAVWEYAWNPSLAQFLEVVDLVGPDAVEAQAGGAPIGLHAHFCPASTGKGGGR